MEESIEQCAVFREIERSQPRAVAGDASFSVVGLDLASNFQALGPGSRKGVILVLVRRLSLAQLMQLADALTEAY